MDKLNEEQQYLMLKLEAIDKQIKQLNSERASIINKKNNDHVLSLEWTKDCTAKLEICVMAGAGIPRFEIIVRGNNNIPYCSTTLKVMGDSKLYEDNMMFSNRPYNLYYDHSIKSVCSFYTSSEDMLFQFLEKVKFKEFQYDTKTLELLLKVQKITSTPNTI